MFEKIWWLKDYWHIIGHTKNLNKKNNFKIKLYGVPLFVYRWNDDKVYTVLDVCPHMKAPLKCVWEGKKIIQCTYHGWQFSDTWDIINIPSSPHLTCKMKAQLFHIQTVEEDGIIYILLNNNSSNTLVTDSFEWTWRSFFTNKIFKTNTDLLIENFMDATHTPIVHNKLIRDDDIKTRHSIEVEDTTHWILVKFSESRENIGGFLSKLFYKKLQISHTDEFLLPNIVRVKYYINSVHRFQADIACNQMSDWKTEAVVRVKYNFWFLNFLLSFIVPFMAKRVLIQDYEITRDQYINRKIFSNIYDTPIDYDYIHKRVQQMRKDVTDWKNMEVKKGIRNITVSV